MHLLKWKSITCAILAGMTGFSVCRAETKTTQNIKPNIVFFLIDDLGYMDVGFNNPRSFYETPNIDALAERGMRFTDGYAACAVCSPTRASIMTGKYPEPPLTPPESARSGGIQPKGEKANS